MSRIPNVAALEAKKADLLAEVKRLDGAIKAAKEKETAAKQKALIDALAARGLLDKPLDELLAVLQAATPIGPAQAQQQTLRAEQIATAAEGL